MSTQPNTDNPRSQEYRGLDVPLQLRAIRQRMQFTGGDATTIAFETEATVKRLVSIIADQERRMAEMQTTLNMLVYESQPIEGGAPERVLTDAEAAYQTAAGA